MAVPFCYASELIPGCRASCRSVCDAGAGDASLDRATLRGLKTLNIEIDKVDPDLAKEGINASALQSRLMDKLQARAFRSTRPPPNSSDFGLLRFTAAAARTPCPSLSASTSR